MTVPVVSALKSRLNEITIMEQSTLEEPFEQQYKFVADKNDNPIFEGFIDNYRTNDVNYQLSMYSAASIDLNRKISVSYINTSITDILKDIIDTYCIYIWYNTGIEVDATLYTKSWIDKRIIDIFRWCNSIEARQHSIRHDNEFYWDTFTSSGITITDASTAINTIPVKSPLIGKKYGRFVIYGGYLDGERLIKDLIIEPAFGTLIDEYSEMTTQAEVDTMATKLSTTWNVAINKIRISVSGLGFIETGQTVTLTLSLYSITVETWYVIESTYNALTDRNDLVLTNAFYQPPVKDITNTDIYNLRQDVGTIADAVNNPTGTGITPAGITLGGHLIDDILISTDGASTDDDQLVTPGWIDANVGGGSLGDLGITATAEEINRIADGILATASEVNTTSDGATAKNTHTHGDIYYTETEINDIENIGSGNFGYQPCNFKGINVGHNVAVNGQISPAAVGASFGNWMVPLDTIKGTNSLHIDAVIITLFDGDSTHEIQDTRLYGVIQATGGNTILGSNSTDCSAIGEFTRTFTAADCSPYKQIQVWFDLQATTTTSALEIASVSVRYWYE